MGRVQTLPESFCESGARKADTPAPQPPGIPSLAMADGAGRAPRPGHKHLPDFSAFCFSGPVPRDLQLGNPESCATNPLTTPAQMVPFGAAYKPTTKRYTRAPTEASLILGCPSIPKSWRRRPCHKTSLNSAPGNFPGTRAPRWAASSLRIFQVAAPCPVRKCTWPWGTGLSARLPTLAHSQERSAQVNANLGGTLV